MLEITIYPDGSLSRKALEDEKGDRTFTDLADLIVKTVDISKYIGPEKPVSLSGYREKNNGPISELRLAK